MSFTLFYQGFLGISNNYLNALNIQIYNIFLLTFHNKQCAVSM